MARVGIDLDGVCYNFSASVERYLFLRQSHRFPGPFIPPTRWEFYEDWGLSLVEFLEICHSGVDAGIIFSDGAPYPGVQDAFAMIKANGHSIHIVTDRSFGSQGASEAATRAWLDRYSLPFDSLTFTADKTAVRLDYMVDDKLANYDALDAAGVDVRLLKRAWNQDDQPRRRVLNLLHFAEVVGARS